MNKKILIGSIIAVVILVLVSFTGVVGYQTTKSSTIARASPLFTARSTRAIDEESKDLTCDYVGKGEESILSIPKRNDRIEMVQKVIDIISRMDDKGINRLTELVNRQLYNDNAMKDVNVYEMFQFIRSNPFEAKNLVGGEDIFPSIYFIPCLTLDDRWQPGCLIHEFLCLIGSLLFVLVYNIVTRLTIGVTIYCCPVPTGLLNYYLLSQILLAKNQNWQ